MNDDTITDLKQFMTTAISHQGDVIRDDLKQFVSITVSQQSAELRTEMQNGFTELKQDISDLSTELKLDSRVTRLERKIV